jgi:hypothetical protein
MNDTNGWRKRWQRVIAPMLLAAPVAACAASSGEADSGLEVSDLRVSIDPRRSLAITDEKILARFSITRVFDQIATTSGDPNLTGRKLFERWVQDVAHGIGLNPYTAPQSFKAIGIFNRFDLADAQGATCGEYRIIFALGTIEHGSPFERRRLIFESSLPNPMPARGLEGCRPVAKLLLELTSAASYVERTSLLEGFFFSGLDGFEPVVHADHLGVRGGQIRESNEWDLDEYKVVRTAGSVEIRVSPHTDALAVGLIGAQTDPSNPRIESFRRYFLGEVEHLAKIEDVNELSLKVPEEFAEGADRLQWFRVGVSAWPDFKSLVQTELTRIGSSLTPQQIFNRAEATTCGGCHTMTDSLLHPLELGGSMSSVIAFGFPRGHIKDFLDNEPESGPDGHRYPLSPALSDVFLPYRKAKLERFLGSDR